MRTTRIFLAAAAAAVLSTAAFAVPPSASQVSVPASTEMTKHQGKMNALFPMPQERMMFRLQMRDATHGMARAEKKAWRKQEMKKIRAMTDSEKAAWRHDLDTKWSALPSDRRQRMEAKMQRHEARHEAHRDRRHGDQGMTGQPQQQQ